METKNNVFIKTIDDNYAIELVDILNNDSRLKDALNSEGKISKLEFIEYNNQWCNKNNAELFAIALNDIAIGTISLSHQNIIERKAQIGYWISSKYWGNGYTSCAFSQVLNLAREKGIKYISATIKDDNMASKRIWIKNGGKIETKDKKVNTLLILDDIF
ncbi:MULTISPECIES: GNAT family N-acetyltransferase [Clostridium]|uniref:GNAT family N-acetyltransferase n=1 Tax=Clostridium faecium TaxID=2762223 RepID=A0ABR8YP61_9CLOT|nr:MULTISPECIES: GNAT family N-acetyltransferase [Clostridium]MBD8045927.1 GNAT family N-acetyltransferase [Clostridium faecium]MDU1348005.1 GNAT family N-acetyltransferase [Clostridium argentinense]